MAKKPPQEPFGCTIAIALLLGVAYALPYLFTFAVYAFPLFVAFLLVFSNWRSRPTPEFIDESQVGAALHDLEMARRSLLEDIADLRARGTREGVRYLKLEDRFEMRSRRGQELNEALANARSALANVVTRIEVAQHPQHRRDHAWRLSMRSWRRGRAFRLAFIAALFSFAASAALLKAYVYEGADLLVWNALPNLIGRHVEVATVFGWVLGLATFLAIRRSNRLAAEREDGSSERHADVLDDIGPQSGDGGHQSYKEIDDPYLILNVSPQATIPEIKAAYRLAIVKCHPDTVADRSKSIREAAEAEAQRVNAAYDSIRNEQGFN
ncbi:DnaJ family molecular chaperone [Bradyrhizobium sp. BR 10261]|uniref:J domain-containing protein n=1 Tax=Bradyrhizobium sp. BR 10261 TaxID=2749992 RepID=UPI001C64804B|nr:J domain-containing protein [Bradyrhizobium sp. BR 10261]MBW7964146.1 J domain-containing protein [Bradyrhizobium sp. BR 10261]